MTKFWRKNNNNNVTIFGYLASYIFQECPLNHIVYVKQFSLSAADGKQAERMIM